jgi:hypothetical protein
MKRIYSILLVLLFAVTLYAAEKWDRIRFILVAPEAEYKADVGKRQDILLLVWGKKDTEANRKWVDNGWERRCKLTKTNDVEHTYCVSELQTGQKYEGATLKELVDAIALAGWHWELIRTNSPSGTYAKEQLVRPEETNPPTMALGLGD